jgi:hypothetical protein
MQFTSRPRRWVHARRPLDRPIVAVWPRADYWLLARHPRAWAWSTAVIARSKRIRTFYNSMLDFGYRGSDSASPRPRESHRALADVYGGPYDVH